MKPTTFPLRLPASLKAAVEQASRADDTSFNPFVVTAVAEKVAAMNAAEFLTARRAQADLEAARRILQRPGGQPPDDPDRLP